MAAGKTSRDQERRRSTIERMATAALAAMFGLAILTAAFWALSVQADIRARIQVSEQRSKDVALAVQVERQTDKVTLDFAKVRLALTEAGDPNRPDASALVEQFHQDLARASESARAAGAGGVHEGLTIVGQRFDTLIALPAGSPEFTSAAADLERALLKVTDTSSAIMTQVAARYEAREDALVAGQYRVLVLAVCLTGLVGVGGLGVIRVLRGRVFRPMAANARYMADLAEGEFDTPPPYLDRPDELGDMARAIDTFRLAALERRRARLQHEAESEAFEQQRISRAEEAERLAQEREEIIDGLSEALEQLAVGDISVRIARPFPAGFDQLRIDFNASMEALGRVMDSILEATEAVSFGASELSRAANTLATRTDQQTLSVKESASSLARLQDEVEATMGSADRVLAVVNATRQSAERSTAVMASAIEAMRKIEVSSGQIGQISSLIDEIAFMTNLLALNAGVEAARAGEAGRGFAVVAMEVRSLAQRSADAAREIKALVTRSDGEVAAGVSQVNETGAALGEIVSQIGAVSGLVAEIAESNRNQTASLGAIRGAVHVIDEITRNNASMVGEATTASQVLADEATGLTASVSKFKGHSRVSEATEDDSPEREIAMAEIDKLFG